MILRNLVRLQGNKKKQVIVYAVILVIILLFASILFSASVTTKNYEKSLKTKDPSLGFETDYSLRVSLENKIRELEEKNAQMQESLVELFAEQEAKEEDPEDLVNEQRIGSLENKIIELEKGLVGKNRKTKKPKTSYESDYSYNATAQNTQQNFNPNRDFINTVGNQNSGQKGDNWSNPQDRSVEILDFSGQNNIYETEHYLPAGSYAKAELISSVDAAVGVTSQASPRPVLLRIKSHAISVSDKEDIAEKQKTDIRGCSIVAEASGDLSSERGYIRLLKMTCAHVMTSQL